MEFTEEWRAVDGWPYEVSDQGRVRRTTKGSNGLGCRDALSLHYNRFNGYLSVLLKDAPRSNRRHVHVLVCTAFHGPRPSPQHVAAHWDGDKTNNVAANLRWATKAENQQDRVRHGTSEHGEKNPCAKLTKDQVRVIFHAREPTAKIAALFGVNQTTVRDIKRGRRWGHLKLLGDKAAQFSRP